MLLYDSAISDMSAESNFYISNFFAQQDAKICFSDDTLPDGFNVNKGDMVSYQPYAMGRMKFIWGDDAEEYKPERWLSKDGVFQQESPFKFTAFQVGGKKYMCGPLGYVPSFFFFHFVL